MTFNISTDTTSNLTSFILKRYNLTTIPLTYLVDGVEEQCTDLSSFDGESFYKKIRQSDVKTSAVNINQYISAWEPILEKGEDILHLSISSGISSAFSAGCAAAEQLQAKYPGRKIYVFDTLAASLGEGLQVLYACKLRESGKDIREVVTALLVKRNKTVQIFSVDDLNFLKKGGRISALAAKIGTVLHVKPVLTSNYCGEIVMDKKVRGRKLALTALADSFEKNFDRNTDDPVGIAYAGCEDDANFLVSLLKKIAPKAEFLLTPYEPVTGSHVGPGTVALFYTCS
jgi:DegV family protein with EDD domain